MSRARVRLYGLALVCLVGVGVSGAQAQPSSSAAEQSLQPTTQQGKALVAPTANVNWRSSEAAILAIKGEVSRIQGLANGNASQETLHGATVGYYGALLELVRDGASVSTAYLNSASVLTEIASRFAVTQQNDLLQIRRNALTLLTQ